MAKMSQVVIHTINARINHSKKHHKTHNRHKYFTLETQKEKSSLNGCLVSIFNNNFVTM